MMYDEIEKIIKSSIYILRNKKFLQVGNIYSLDIYMKNRFNKMNIIWEKNFQFSLNVEYSNIKYDLVDKNEAEWALRRLVNADI